MSQCQNNMGSPYEIETRPAVVSFSGGRTSAFMLRQILDHYGELPDDVQAVFCNTGKEHPATLDFVLDCQDNWGVDIKWLEYRYDRHAKGGIKDPKHTYEIVDYGTASRNGEPFMQLTRAKWKLPSVAKRFCTVELKIKTITRYVERELGWKNHVVVLGMRYDEPQRIRRSLMEMCKVEYPLYHASISEDDVNRYWADNYFDLAIPNYLGNCDMCFLKNKGKLRHIAKKHPDLVDWWIEEEKQLYARLKERHGWVTISAQFNPHMSYEQLLIAAQSQPSLFDDLGIDMDAEDIDCFCGD